MILRDGKPYALPKEKVDYVRTFLKNGVVEIRMSQNLKTIEKGKDDKLRPFTREVFPPSISIPAYASVMEADGGHEYRYATNHSIVNKKDTYFPASIGVPEGGRRESDLDLLFFLMCCSPFLKDGEAFRNEKALKPEHQPYLEFYDQTAYDEIDMQREKTISKAKYLISNEWDRKKLLEVAGSMFISFNGDEADSTIQKAILSSINASKDPMKWEKFLTSASDDQAEVHASGVLLLANEGIFSFEPSRRAWVLNKDGFKKDVVVIRPSDMGNTKRALSEALQRNPSIMTEAQAEYTRILASKAAPADPLSYEEIAKREISKKRYSVDDAKPLGSSALDEGTDENPAGGELEESTGSVTLDAALAAGVIVREKGWYKFGAKTLGNSATKFEDALSKDPEIHEAITLALLK